MACLEMPSRHNIEITFCCVDPFVASTETGLTVLDILRKLVLRPLVRQGSQCFLSLELCQKTLFVCKDSTCVSIEMVLLIRSHDPAFDFPSLSP